MVEREDAHEGLNQLRSYIARIGVVLLCMFVLFSLYRFAGESDRQNERIQRSGDQLEAAITADCGFHRSIANLPAEAIRQGQRLTPTLVALATSSRTAYVGKHCERATNPADGEPYGPPPPLYKLPAGG